MTSFFIGFSVESVEKDMVFGTSPFGCNLGYDNAVDIILNSVNEVSATVDRSANIVLSNRLLKGSSTNRTAVWPSRS